MADLTGTNLNPNVEETGSAFTVIADGNYNAVIIGDRVVDTKKKDGKMLEIKWQIIDEGPFQGETIIDRLNIQNPSIQAQNIGQGQLKRICGLCGVTYPPQNTDGLVGKPINIKIVTEEFKSNNTGNMLKSNKISGYNPVKEMPEVEKRNVNNGGW